MTGFGDLVRRRREYVRAAQDNGFEDGLRSLLADLYPDNAHFIYELLQNAEDAHAGTVIFELRPDGLLVEHDGARVFDLDDVRSITGIGQSTKADDATSIGKFGVGFKAVFAYTRNPQIVSGPFAFAIRDLFVPDPITNAVSSSTTRFWLPFDRPDKVPTTAFAEVRSALVELSRRTLLFLAAIESIECRFPDGSSRRLRRTAIDENVVSIEDDAAREGPAFWYRVVGTAIVGERSHTVAAAFDLHVRKGPGASGRAGADLAVRATDGQVFIYFPAVKESSGLRFHIHAPFASTVARDSVRDDPSNDVLLDHLARIVVEALPRMRDNGMTAGLLTALPNDSDDLDPRYAPMRERIVAAFDNEALTPSVSRSFEPAARLVRSDSSVRSALTVDDVEFLFDLAGADASRARTTDWLPDRDGRAGAFLNSLHARVFDRDALTRALHTVAKDHRSANSAEGPRRDRLSRWHAWLEGKDDAALRGLYATVGSFPTPRFYLRRPSDVPELSTFLPEVPLVRVWTESGGVQHVVGTEAFLPTAAEIVGPGLVSHAVRTPAPGAGTATAHAVEDFFDLAGVRSWDAATQLELRCAGYPLRAPALTPDHLADLELLSRLLSDKSVAPQDWARRPLLLAETPAGDLEWAPASDVFVDHPLRATGLTALYAHPKVAPRRRRLAAVYAATELDVASLAETLGARTAPVVEPAQVGQNRLFKQVWLQRPETEKRTRTDWQIAHLPLIVSSDDDDLLRGLWDVVARTAVRYGVAVYQANGSSPTNTMDSQLLQSLKSMPWVLDRDGNLRTPDDIGPDDLAEGLAVPEPLGLLGSTGFGKKAARRAAQQSDDERRAREYGFASADELSDVLEKVLSNRQGFEEWARAVALPDAASAAPEARASHAARTAGQAPRRLQDHRVRSVFVQEPGHRSTARRYLVAMYTNTDGELVCQVCARDMPFRIGDQPYFEAVQFVSDGTRDLVANRLALCPTCAAKYRHALETPTGELRAALLELPVGQRPSVTLTLRMAGASANLRFVGKHAIDLQGALHTMPAATHQPVVE